MRHMLVGASRDPRTGRHPQIPRVLDSESGDADHLSQVAA
jgi:hypothetical protein